MKANVSIAILLGALVAAAAAQDADDGGRRGMRGGPGRMLNTLPDSLDLNDEQRAQFDRLVAAHRQRAQGARAQREELRRARRDGDEQRVAELRSQVGDNAWNPWESLRQTLDQIEPILSDEQRVRFSEVRQESQQRYERRQGVPGGEGFGRPGGPPRRGPGRMLDRFVEPLELNDEQRAEFEQIMAEHGDRTREARELSRAMGLAMRSGDTQKAEELRTQMFELGIDPWDSLQQVLDEVEPILNDEQFERFSEMRATFQQRREGRETLRRWTSELPDAVNMTEGQRQQFNEYLRVRRGGWRQYIERLQAVRRDMREARSAGDMERLAELEAELDASRPDSTARQDELAEAVREMLNEDQLPMLDSYLDSAGGGRANLPGDVRSLVRAAARSRLDRPQRKEWRIIMRDAIKSLRRIDRKDEKAKSALAADTRSKIEAMLNEDQVKRFEKELERLTRRRKRESASKGPKEPQQVAQPASPPAED